MSENVSIIGLSKAAVLAALYNGARAQGYGLLQYDPTPMTEDEAAPYLAQGTYFDYLKGRVMKVEIAGDELYTRLYDRDNGEGAAERIITALRKGSSPNDETIEQNSLENTRQAALQMRQVVAEETTVREEGEMFVLNLGAAQDADKFKPVLDDILGESDE